MADPLVTQAPVELLSQPVLPPSHVGQYAVELLSSTATPSVVTQCAVEVLSENLAGSGGGGPGEGLGTSTDLTTLFAGYFKTLIAANSGKDLTTVVMKELPSVRVAVPTEVDDINTMYDSYLEAP